MAIISVAWQVSLGARRENAWYRFYTVWSFSCTCMRAQLWRLMSRRPFSRSCEWVGTYVFINVRAKFVCAHAHSIYVCFLIWTNMCVYVCRQWWEVLGVWTRCSRASIPPTPASSIPWDRNKEARLHQAGLWSAQLYRVPICNWQPSDPGCFLCNMHTWKVLMSSDIPYGLLYFMYTTGSCSQYVHVAVILKIYVGFPLL